MKKLLILFPLLLLTILPAASQDARSAPEVAPITTFVAAIGQQLEFSTAQIVSGTKMELKETVILKALKPETLVHIKVTMTPKAPPENPTAKMDEVILAEQTMPWTGLPEDVLKAILEQNKPALQSKVIDGKSFQYIEVSLRGRTFWFVTDGKKSAFPGVLKITQKHNDHVDVLLELKKIVDPPKK